MVMPSGGARNWEPSVSYLLILVVVEIFVFGALRALTNHGG